MQTRFLGSDSSTEVSVLHEIVEHGEDLHSPQSRWNYSGHPERRAHGEMAEEEECMQGFLHSEPTSPFGRLLSSLIIQRVPFVIHRRDRVSNIQA